MNDVNKEIWVDVPNYEGKYQVSSLGRVKSLKFGKEKILKQGKLKNNYKIVNLYKNGKINGCLVHRLVALAFIPNPSSLPCINHKDENPSNNVVSNLEWCTYQYNNTYGTVRARRVASTDWKEVGRKNAEKLSRQVFQYSLDGELIKIWESTREAGKNGYNQGAVSQCCNGNRKSHRGFIWSYTEIF